MAELITPHVRLFMDCHGSSGVDEERKKRKEKKRKERKKERKKERTAKEKEKEKEKAGDDEGGKMKKWRANIGVQE